MKRRSFIHGAVTAIAMGLAPAFLNKTSLALASDYAEGRCVGTMSVWRVSEDGTREFISAKEIPVEDMGVDFTPYQGERKTFHFPVEGNISEVGITREGKYRRFEFEKPVTIRSDEQFLVEYDYRLS